MIAPFLTGGHIHPQGNRSAQRVTEPLLKKA